MYGDEEFWEHFSRPVRRFGATIAVVVAAGGYLYYRHCQPPPPKTPQQNLAILRDHKAAQSARHLAAGRLKPDRSVVPNLIEELEHGDDNGRLLAAMALGSMGDEAGVATEAMIRAAQDASPFVRRQVAAALPKISGDRHLVVSSLDPLLHDSDMEARRLAFESLLAQGEPGRQATIRLLNDADADVRRRAATALARTGSENDAIQALRRALDDEDADVRAAALRSLYQLEAVGLRELAGMIGQEKLRTTAGWLLRERKADAQAAIPSLRELLKSDDRETVKAAAFALGEIGPAARITSLDLIALADDRRPYVGSVARNVLTRIGLESEFKPPELWEQLETSVEDVYSLNLEPAPRPPVPNRQPVGADADLAHVARLHNLRLLTLSRTSVGDNGLVRLADLKSLERLDLESTGVTSAGLLHLEKLETLRSLNLNNCAVEDEGLLHVKKLTRLETLKLLGTRITNDGLAHLSGLADLQSIWLPAQVTDAGLTYLQPLVGLEEISGGQFSPQWVARFPNLTSVGLHLPSVTDGDLAPLTRLPHLRTLRLQGTAITDAALEFLCHLGQLEDLNIENTAVTDAGLKHLKALAGLRYLHVDGKHEKTLTAVGIDDLRRSMPRLRID
ncbi:MAG TPA: HEAT repeat domain-containing protein [Pirellulales bacterium]|nr:HEAT repeat domain-containing protein [Pirellulales bacterium]